MNPVRIPFPLGGIERRVSFQDSEPQKCHHALNVTPDTSQGSGRVRGGSRPGLTRRFTQNVGASPQFMVSVVTVNEDPYEIIVIGTSTDVYRSSSTRNVGPPVTYTEALTGLAGVLEVQDGETLEVEAGDPLEISSYNLGTVERGTVTPYQGNIILAGTGNELVSEAEGAFNSGILSSTAIADWTALGIDLNTHLIELFGAAEGSFAIQTINTGSIRVANAPNTSGDVTFKIVEAPRVLNFTDEILSTLVPTTGTVPTGAQALAVYRNRLVFAKDRAWFMSRVGNIYDYDYGADANDLSRAVGATSSDAGQPGTPIIALAPGGYDYLVMFGEDETWVLRGDPVYGGQLYPLSRDIGCVDALAWCHGQSNEVYFLSKNGLYVISPDVSSPPQPLSQEVIPRELQVADRDNYDTVLVYDSEDEGILIIITPKDGTAGTHWWFDISTQSFWPIQYSTSHQPVTAVGFSGNPTLPRRVLMLSSDGFVREMRGTDDDGTAIASEVVLGPYAMNEQLDLEGLVTELVGSTDTASGNVTVSVFVADTPEEAAEAAQANTDPFCTGTMLPGRSYKERMRARGSAFCIRLAATSQWAFEMLQAKIQTVGMRRV